MSEAQTIPLGSEASPVERSRRRSPRRSRLPVGRTLTTFGTFVSVAAVAAAPLLAGTVHDVTITIVAGAMVVGLVSLALGLAADRRDLRVGVVVVVPLLFLVVPAVQSIPLPVWLRKLFDINGTALLVENHLAAPAQWPLSLDPVTTRVYIGRAAAALAAFVVAYHLAGGQSRRHLLARAIAIAGIAAVVIGLGHRVLGVSKLYGVLGSTGRTLMVGPFVNSNHTAEFLELAAFVCLACSFQRQTALNRVGWLVGMLFCTAGAIATLSRGAVAAFAMAVLMFVFLRYTTREVELGTRRKALAWGGFLIGLVLLGAGALGAGELIDRFRAGAMTTDVRFQLWRDSWQVLRAHPWGIGRGAFDRVFPVYRTLTTPNPLRFAYVENEPLQLLLDVGWIPFAALSLGIGLAVWNIARHGRRDPIESALVAGLFGVLVHSLVDFGLETLGVLLPFAAVLGLVLGRSRQPVVVSLPVARIVPAIAVAGLVVGLASIGHASNENFDKSLKHSRTVAEQRQVLVRAQQIHPIDYFYALAYARVEPIQGDAGTPSPRLHALNRALRLCPGCEQVHQEVARSLWRLGRRHQALMEWRTAVRLQPRLFEPVLAELFASGARAEELSALATSQPARMVDVAAFLSSISRLADAFVVLDQADALGAPPATSLLTRGRLLFESQQFAAAKAVVSKAHEAHIDDPRLPLLEAKLLASEGGPSVDKALAVLDAAASRYPEDLDLLRYRLSVVFRFERWHGANRAVQGLEQALYRLNSSVGEAHTAAARVDARLARWSSALGKYRIALADSPNDPALWVEYGRTAELAGRDPTAREAYGQAARLSPRDPDIAAALARLSEREPKLKAAAAPGLD
jgi:tetratricopeptide (TPR) repeat protein